MLLNKILSYIIAIRPWTFGSTLTPVLLGSVLAYKYNLHNLSLKPNLETKLFNIFSFILTLIITISVHGAGNLINTYYDHLHGIDFTKGFKGKHARDRTLLDNIISPKELVNYAGLLYIMGCIGLLLLAYNSPTCLEHLSLVYFGGISGSFLYTGGAHGLKQFICLGDLVAMTIFGPVCVIFSFLSQTPYNGYNFMSILVIYSLPLFFWTEAILHSNNSIDSFLTKKTSNDSLIMDDATTEDQRADQINNSDFSLLTMADIIGPYWSTLFFTGMLMIPYIFFLYQAFIRSTWFILPILTLNKAIKTAYNFYKYLHYLCPESFAVPLTIQLAQSYKNCLNCLSNMCHWMCINFTTFKISEKFAQNDISSSSILADNAAPPTRNNKEYQHQPASIWERMAFESMKNISHETSQIILETSVLYILACYLTPSELLFP